MKTNSGWERLRAWFLLPAWIWMAVLFAAPFAIVIVYSLLTRGAYGGLGLPWTVENYQRLFDPLYLSIVLRSFAMAAATTVICLLLGFPLALFISRAGSRKNIYLQLVILPFWTSFLVRLYAWLFLPVYSRTPFAPITNGQMLDYATGKWAPARFHNYLTGQWIEGVLPADAMLSVGTWDPVLGRTYVQIAREGWGEQKSQYGGANPALSGPDSSSYHLWAVAPSAVAGSGDANDSLFRNAKVNIDTGITGLARLAGNASPQWLADDLGRIQSSLNAFTSDCKNQSGVDAAHKLVPIYRETLDLYARVQASDLNAEANAGLELELGEKIVQFQTALKDLL